MGMQNGINNENTAMGMQNEGKFISHPLLQTLIPIYYSVCICS